MGKLEELRRYAGNAAESAVGNRAYPLPPGLRPEDAVSKPAKLNGVTRDANQVKIEVDRIQPDPDQPREEFDDAGLARLAESLRTKGQLQPVRVRWDEPAQVYRLVCGERRWRAAKLAGLGELACVMHVSSTTPDELLALQLIENALREDLRPVEQAKAYRSLMDRNGWTTRQVASELSVDQSSVVRALALLNLPEELQHAVEEGQVAATTAYELTKAEGTVQDSLIQEALTTGLTHKAAVAAVRKRRARAGKVTKQTFRTTAGPRLTLEWGRGLTDEIALRAIREVLTQLEDVA